MQGGPLHGVNPLRKVVSVFRLGIGTLQATTLLLRKRPAVAFLTGGWVGVPIAVAARLLRVPVVIFVPDVEPGRTLSVLGRFASAITATVAETAQFYAKNKTVIATGYPLRDGLLDATREAGLAAFGLSAECRTLLVFGGSRGSRAINRMIYNHMEHLLTVIPDLQILHISGQLDAEEVAAAHHALPANVQARYHVRDYVHEMGLALAAADLVVSRAGAATLAELPAFGLPAILVPLAYDWHYQEVNADWLAERGAAIRLDEGDMQTQLIPLLQTLFVDDPARYRAMVAAAESLKKTDGAQAVAGVILDQATK